MCYSPYVLLVFVWWEVVFPMTRVYQLTGFKSIRKFYNVNWYFDLIIVHVYQLTGTFTVNYNRCIYGNKRSTQQSEH